MLQMNISKSIRAILIFIALATFLIVLIGRNQDPLDWSNIRLDPFWAGISVLAAAAHLLLASILWWKTLCSSGIPIRINSGVHAYLVSDLGKFIPGKIWAVAGRAAILSKEGVSYSATITASALEILLTMISGILIGITYFLHEISWSILSQSYVITLFLVVAFLLIAAYPKTQAFLLRLLGLEIKHRHPIGVLSFRNAILLIILYIALWIFSGLLHICIFTAISSVPTPDLLTMSSIIALSTTLGFAAIFAPGGIGVREAMMVSLLLPFVPVEIAAVFALLSRFIITVSQGLVTVLAASIYSCAGHRDGVPVNTGTIRVDDTP